MKRKIALGSIIIVIIILDIISINRIINVNGIIESYGANMLLQPTKPIVNCTIFTTFFVIFAISYITIIEEKCEKIKLKYIVISISIITVLAGIALPNNSSDIYYYMAVGRLDSHYNSNSFEQIFETEQNKHLDDQIVAASPKLKVKFTYGALWEFICRSLSSIPINSTLCMLMLYKFVNIVVHTINCVLIYKISKKENKKRNVLIYGLNPLIIFEGIINCHNDMFVILFILLALYFKNKEKIVLAVGSIALGTLIKYVPILLLPYILKDQKIKKILLYIIEFTLIFVIISYVIIGKFSGMLVFLRQTGEYANSLYLTIYIILRENMQILKILNIIGKIIFVLVYLFWMYQIFLSDRIKKKENKIKNKDILKRKDAINKIKSNSEDLYENLILLFLLLVVTNFRTWYMIWLFGMLPIISEKMQKRIVALSIIGEAANCIIYFMGEAYTYGAYYFYAVVLGYMLYTEIQKTKEENNKENIYKRQELK